MGKPQVHVSGLEYALPVGEGRTQSVKPQLRQMLDECGVDL